MHSLMMAQEILKTALIEAEKHNANHIKSINVKIGDGHFAESDSIQFCMEAAAKGTIAERAHVEIELMETTIRCPLCNYKASSPTGYLTACPNCGNKNIEVTSCDEPPQITLQLD